MTWNWGVPSAGGPVPWLPTAQAGWWNISNLSQRNPVRDLLGHPVGQILGKKCDLESRPEQSGLPVPLGGRRRRPPPRPLQPAQPRVLRREEPGRRRGRRRRRGGRGGGGGRGRRLGVWRHGPPPVRVVQGPPGQLQVPQGRAAGGRPGGLEPNRAFAACSSRCLVSSLPFHPRPLLGKG